MKKTFILLITSILLVSCTAQATGTVVPVISAPSSTATERPRPTPTLPPTSTQEPTQTPDPLLATKEAALDSCRGNNQDSIDQYVTQGYSATRFWSATVCQDDGIYTKVTELGKNKIFKVAAIDTNAKTSGPDWVWEPYLWSLDRDFLFLKPSYLGTADNAPSLYSNGFGLMQLDLNSGERDVPLKPRSAGYTFTLSEDGRLFAFLSDVPRTIIVRDVKIKEENQLSLKENYKILEMRWTPDGARLIILTEESAEDPAQGGFSIFEYNLERDTLKKLVDKNNLNSLYSPDPSAEPRIFISGLSNEFLSLSDKLQAVSFEVNLQTGEVIPTNDVGIPTDNS